MTNLRELTKLGSGATATVYLFDENKILKVFNDDYSAESVKYEAFLSDEINKTAIRAPRYYETISVEGKNGIVSEYIPGELLMQQLVKSDFFSCVSLIRRMVRAQKEIHQAQNRAITSQIARFSYLIGNSGLEESKQKKLIDALQSIEQSDHVCHGDFHPGNIIVHSRDAFYTIDWMNCYCGNVEGDVCRSYLTLITPFDPFNLPFLQKIIFQLYKLLIGQIYLAEYLRNTKIKKRDIRRWMSIVAAGRLADNVPNEREWLTKRIDRTLKYLSPGSF